MWEAIGSLKNRIWSTLLLGVAVSVLFLYNWTAEAVGTAHIQPSEPQEDLSEIIEKAESGDGLSEAERKFLAG